MNERNDNKTNETREMQQYNLCPACGRRAYEVYTDDGMYQVGCIHCGTKNGVCADASEMTEEMTEKLRIEWNHSTLAKYFEIEAREELGIGIGGYVMVRKSDGYIVRYADSMREVVEYLRSTGYDEAYEIYHHMDGILQDHCSSFAVSTIVEVFEN